MEAKIKQVKVDHPLLQTQRKTNGAKFDFCLNCNYAGLGGKDKERGFGREFK